MPRDSEVEKLKSRIGQLENEKNDLIKQLHTKNVDLTRHENFTTSELDSLKKKEETLKTELNRERQRRQELAMGIIIFYDLLNVLFLEKARTRAVQKT